MPSLNEPTKLFRDSVADGKIVHDGSPLLTWSVGNAQEIVDTKENIMISKKHAGDTNAWTTRRSDRCLIPDPALPRADELSGVC